MKAKDRILGLLVHAHPRAVSGAEIGQICGLWSGSLYVALYQLERAAIIESDWEDTDRRPRRRFYSLVQPPGTRQPAKKMETA